MQNRTNTSAPRQGVFDSGVNQRTIVDYLSRGWRLIPVGSDKKPLCKWGDFTAAPQSFTSVWNALADPRCTGAAVALGPSGIAVADYDDSDAYERWRKRRKGLNRQMPLAKTSRGYHLFFRANGLCKTTVMPWGELRAGPSYVVLPPSKHLSGCMYEWINPLPENDGDIPYFHPAMLPDMPSIPSASGPATLLAHTRRLRFPPSPY